MHFPRRFAFGGAEIEVLAPPADYVPTDSPKNNDSLVLRVALRAQRVPAHRRRGTSHRARHAGGG